MLTTKTRGPLCIAMHPIEIPKENSVPWRYLSIVDLLRIDRAMQRLLERGPRAREVLPAATGEKDWNALRWMAQG
jgi:hypothetical protein